MPKLYDVELTVRVQADTPIQITDILLNAFAETPVVGFAVMMTEEVE